jgi:hypothetical protein
MMPGDIAVLMDSHVGVDDDMRSYVMTPGDSGLVISIDGETTTLLISNHIVYVQTFSLAKMPMGPENMHDFH